MTVPAIENLHLPPPDNMVIRVGCPVMCAKVKAQQLTKRLSVRGVVLIQFVPIWMAAISSE